MIHQKWFFSLNIQKWDRATDLNIPEQFLYSQGHETFQRYSQGPPVIIETQYLVNLSYSILGLNIKYMIHYQQNKIQTNPCVAVGA